MSTMFNLIRCILIKSAGNRNVVQMVVYFSDGTTLIHKETDWNIDTDYLMLLIFDASYYGIRTFLVAAAKFTLDLIFI